MLTESVNSKKVGVDFAIKAPTRTAIPPSEVGNSNNVLVSTVTFAEPKCFVSIAMVDFNSHKTAKSLTGYIKQWDGHNAGFSSFSAGLKDARKPRPAMNEAFGNDPIRAPAMQAA